MQIISCPRCVVIKKGSSQRLQNPWHLGCAISYHLQQYTFFHDIKVSYCSICPISVTPVYVS